MFFLCSNDENKPGIFLLYFQKKTQNCITINMCRQKQILIAEFKTSNCRTRTLTQAVSKIFFLTSACLWIKINPNVEYHVYIYTKIFMFDESLLLKPDKIN
jgi:hypothetical protein